MEILLRPGTLLTQCAVVCHKPEAEIDPYQVHFHADGRALMCPLHAFQPRTQAWKATAAESNTNREAVAV